jgi:hypothetical protein
MEERRHCGGLFIFVCVAVYLVIVYTLYMQIQKYIAVTLCALVVALCTGVSTVRASTLLDSVRGKIVLDVENDGAAWYVYPANDHRYSLGSGKQAYKLMRSLGLGITNENLKKIPKEGEPWNAEPGLMEHVQGRILLQVENNGEAWYVNPENGRRYYMKDGPAAYELMRNLGVGITEANLEHIPPTKYADEPLEDYTGFETKTINTDNGAFSISLITIQKSRYIMVTDTANEEDCDNNCPVKPLADYVNENDAVLGIHGTYFCPSDYSSCSGKVNSFLPPVFNTTADTMINEDALKFHEGPLLTVTTNDKYHFYHRATTYTHITIIYDYRLSF